MKQAQECVRRFHEAFSISIGNFNQPAIREGQLRINLVTEEAKEFVEAVEKGDLVETIDAMCDLIYVVLGSAVTFGIDLEPFFQEVHASNMRKVGGWTREDGKYMKPEGWTPPKLLPLLDLQKRTCHHYAWKGVAQSGRHCPTCGILMLDPGD